MRHRLDLIWAAILGRPIIHGVTFRGAIVVAEGTPSGLLVSGNRFL